AKKLLVAGTRGGAIVDVDIEFLNAVALAGEQLNAWLRGLFEIIFAKRVSFKLFVKKNTTKVWMAFEFDSVHIPDFALLPASRTVEGVQAWQRQIGFVEHDAKDQHVFVLHAVEHVDHLESRLAGQVIDGGNCAQVIHFCRGIVAQSADDFDDLVALDSNRVVAESGVSIEYFTCKLFLNKVDELFSHDTTTACAA